MFTGIVQSQVNVISITTKNQLSRLVIAVKASLVSNLEIGASIAINGVCLTVVEYGKHKVSNESTKDIDNTENTYSIAFDVIDETLGITTLGNLSVKDLVNIERSLKVGDELGGHIVSGHVQYKSALVAKDVTPTNTALYFKCDEPWLKYIFEKGFITVNGVSLTIGKIKDNTFSVHLIPETLTRTNLGKLNINDKVNLEFDQQTITIVQTIERLKLNELS